MRRCHPTSLLADLTVRPSWRLFPTACTDNGGPTTTGDGVGARNWPLRGGKHSAWEGGVRATGVISGKGVGVAGGTEFNHLMHGADWLPTLAAAVGIAPADVGGALPLDGVSHWAALSGTPGATPQRTNITLGNSTNAVCVASDLCAPAVALLH